MRWRDVKQNKIPEQNTKKTPQTSRVYASLPDRFKAFLTDTFLLAMPLFYLVIYLIFDGLKEVETYRTQAWFYILIPLGVIVILFYTIAGQTPGMKAYELKIVEHKTGKKPSFLLAFLRFFFFNLLFLFTIPSLYFRKDRRGLHDQFSGTTLVKESKKEKDA